MTLALVAHAVGQVVPQDPTQGVQGPPAPSTQEAPTIPIVRKIEVLGAKRYTVERLIEALGQRVGTQLDRVTVDRGIKTLWQSFHVRAKVSASEVVDGVELVLEVVELPADLEPRFVGNDGIDDATLIKWAGLDDSKQVYLHQAPRVRQRLIEGYHAEGFYWADVDIVTKGGESSELDVPADVIFEIREGPKVRVSDVVITGNDSMPDTGFGFWKDGVSALSKRELDGPHFTNWKGEPYVKEVLDSDLVAMRNVYRDRGWLDAVVEVTGTEFNEERNRVTIHIRVDEGPRWRVSTVAIRAFEWENPDGRDDDERVVPAELVFPEAELSALCDARPGIVWEERVKAHDRLELRKRYGSTGRIQHPSLSRRVNWTFLDPDLVFDQATKTVAVMYRVVQGRPVRLHEIRFAGTTHTRDRVLRTELSVYPGEIADLDEIQKSLARIQGTGFFNDDMNPEQHRDPTYRFRAVPGETDLWDLEFVVEEGRVVNFNITGGVDSNEGLFGLLQLSMRNFDIADAPSAPWRALTETYDKEAFHGAGQKLSIELSPGTVVQRYGVNFYEPDIFNLYRQPIGLDLDFQKRLRIYDTHDEDRFEGAVRLRRRFTHDFSVGLGFKYNLVDVTDIDSDGVPPTLAAQEKLGDQAFQGLVADASWRDVDNLLSPRRGYWVRANSKLYGGAFGGDADFVQTEFSADGYFPLGEPEVEVVPGIHVGLDFGLSDEYGDTSDVPYTERYQGGGTNILRGFEYRGVGPSDKASGFPLGGETYLAGTVEYQYPLFKITQPGTYRQIETLRATVFFDWGVFDPDPYSLDLGEMRTSIGFGVGLAYPLPLTLNFGFPIDIQDGDVRRTFSFSIGLR
ncbi:MAG: BamA/TamA family outer membrane protein [Planctomycetes bacterium]|nr:BamA/TamA family outer membrane protein [Planctomycetota bacterium]